MDVRTIIKQECEGAATVPRVEIIHTTAGSTPETFTVQHIPGAQLHHHPQQQQQQQIELEEQQQSVVVGGPTIVAFQPHIQQQPQIQPSTSPTNHLHRGGGGSEGGPGSGGGGSSDEQEFTVIPQQSRTKTKSFYCPNCGNCYGAAGSLKLHIRACLKQKETEARHMEARMCNICGKIYNSVSYLKEHILRHSGKAPKKCPKCYRKFMDDEKLNAHLKTHEKEQVTGETDEKKIIKEYSCSFCQKKFTVVFDSRYTKRRYACDECRDKFTNEENLRHHKESLEKKKDFHCERCGRKFVFEGFLQRHLPTCDGTIKRKRDRVF